MRELTITADDMAPAPRRKVPTKKKAAAAREPAPPRWAAARATIFKGVVWGGFGLLMSGIVLNAAFNQKGHHPAPILGVPDPASVAAAPPRSQMPAVAALPTPAAPAQSPRDVEPLATGSVAAPADGIGAVLAGKSMAGASKAAAPKAAVKSAAAKPAAAKHHPATPHVAAAVRTKPAKPSGAADRTKLTSLFAAASKAH